MTSSEFIIWLKGFTEGVHEFNITPKQWDLMKDKLAQVNDELIRTSGYIAPYTVTGSNSTFSVGGFPNTTITYTTNDKTLLHD